MNIVVDPILVWSIGLDAKAEYFTAKKQNKEDVYFALREIVDSYEERNVASFSAFIKCIDNPKLSETYHIKLYFNNSGDTYVDMDWNRIKRPLYWRELRNKDYEKYVAIMQDMFKSIVDTRDFKKFARKATTNIQDCFNNLIEPLYRGELKVSDKIDIDLDLDLDEKKVRNALEKLMKLKTRIVSSATLNLSKPEIEIM